MGLNEVDDGLINITREVDGYHSDIDTDCPL